MYVFYKPETTKMVLDWYVTEDFSVTLKVFIQS